VRPIRLAIDVPNREEELGVWDFCDYAGRFIVAVQNTSRDQLPPRCWTMDVALVSLSARYDRNHIPAVLRHQRHYCRAGEIF
jgi:hypothetical protein